MSELPEWIYRWWRHVEPWASVIQTAAATLGLATAVAVFARRNRSVLRHPAFKVIRTPSNKIAAGVHKVGGRYPRASHVLVSLLLAVLGSFLMSLLFPVERVVVTAPYVTEQLGSLPLRPLMLLLAVAGTVSAWWLLHRAPVDLVDPADERLARAIRRRVVSSKHD